MKGLKVFLAVLLLFSTDILAQAQECVDKPIYKDDQVRRFKVTEKDFIGSTTNTLGNGIYKVILKNGKRTVFEIDGENQTEVTTSAADELRRLFFQPTSKFEYLKFPLCVGASWETTYSTTLRGSNKLLDRTATSRVLGITEITVSAGIFRVFEISRLAVGASGSVGSSAFTFFYSEEVGLIVSYYYDAGVVSGSGGKRIIEYLGSD